MEFRFVSFRFVALSGWQHGALSLSELDYTLAPTGMEATYPKETATHDDSRPGVSILVGGTRVAYDALGLRIVVPSQHTLGGRKFSAELQIVHGRRKHTPSTGGKDHPAAAVEGAPSFLVLGLWIDPTATALQSNSNSNAKAATRSSQEALGEVLVEWQTAVESREALCNRTSDGAAVAAEGTSPMPPEAPETGGSVPGTVPSVVVGRGNEQNFENNPIRRRRRRLEEFANQSPKTPYDWWDIAQHTHQTNPFSFYAYEREREHEGAGACNAPTTTVLWNLAETSLEISDEQLATMRSLVLGYRGANCQPFPASSTPSSTPSSTRNAPAVTRVCRPTEEERLSSREASSSCPVVALWWSGVGIAVPVVVLASMAARLCL